MRKHYYVFCLLLAVASLLAACGPEVAPPPPVAPATSSEVEAEAHSDAVWVVRQDESRDTLPSTEQTMLAVREGVDVDEVGRAVLRFADLLAVEVLRQGQLQVQELDIDERSALITVAQGFGTALYDYHPQEQIDRRLNVTTDFAQVVATGTRFMIVREAESPLEWVLAFDAARDDLTVEAEGMTEGVPTGIARWVAPIDGPSLPISFDAENVEEWVAKARAGQAEPEIGEVLWPQADVVADTTVLDEIPEPGESFFLEGVRLELDPRGLYGKPEYWLDDCNGDGINDIAMRNGQLNMDFRQVLSRVRALDVTIINLGQPGNGALTVLDPAREEMDIHEITAREGEAQVLSMRSEPGQPYHYAELAMGHGCFLGFSLTPPLPTGEPAEPRPAVDVGEEEPLCTVVTSKLNVRSGPGTVYGVTSQVDQGMELEPLGRDPSAGWIFVRVLQTGRQGWVSGGTRYVSCNVDIRDLEPLEAPPTPPPPPTDVPVVSGPTIDSFYADPPEIPVGGCSVLRWGATQSATGVYIEPGIGGVGTPGQREVCPTKDTTYVMTLEGPGGTATRSVLIAVSSPVGPTIDSFYADPPEIPAGGCSVLRWGETQNATGVYIEPGIGGVGTPGQREVCPTKDTTYVMTLEGPGGTARRSVLVAVSSPVGPTIDYFYADPPKIPTDGCSVLRWGATQNATGVYIEPGIGGVGTPGQREVCPTKDTTYVMTLVGPGGEATISTVVTVQAARIPNPVLVLDGSHEYTTSAGAYVSYDLTVENWARFPAELFQAAPDLPPCGSNTNASRTWVEIRDGGNDAYIYGFCALSSPDRLTDIWFGVRKNETPPRTVYVVLKDRRNNVSYRSNTVTIWTPRPID